MHDISRRAFLARAACASALAPFAYAARGDVPAAGNTLDWRLTPIADNAVYARRRPMRGALYCESANKTFLSWMGHDCHPYVMAYDHGAEEWAGPLRVGASQQQSFNKWPVMAQDAEGFIHIFYGAHNAELRHTIAPAPGAIDGEWNDTGIGVTERASYPMPVRAANGDLYVFYRFTDRRGPDFRPYVYIKSVDNGRSWSEPAQAIWHETPRPHNLNEIYVGAIVEQPAGEHGPERFLISWSIAGGGPEQERHVAYTKDIYCAAFVPSQDAFYSVGGAEIGPFIDDPDAQEHCLAYDTGELDPEARRATFWHSVAPSFNPANGNPIVAFGVLNKDRVALTGDGRDDWHQEIQYDGKVAIWDDGRWVHRDVAEQLPIKAIQQCGPDCFRAYCGADGVHVFESIDGGHTWAEEVTMEARNAAMFNVVDQARPEIMALVTQREQPLQDGRPGHSPDEYRQNFLVWTLGVGSIPAPQ